MLTNKQQQNIQTNLQRIILENKAKILSEIYHSPEMYKILLEDNKAKRPPEDQTLFVVFETLLNSEDFMRQNIGLLSLDTLTEEQEKIVYTNLNEGLGSVVKAVAKGAKKAVKWIKDKWFGVRGIPPGGFRPTWRDPTTGQWHYQRFAKPNTYWPIPAGTQPGEMPPGYWRPSGTWNPDGNFPHGVDFPEIPNPPSFE
jgi:hypothetical protein